MQSSLLYSEIKLNIYHCRNCNNSFLPKYVIKKIYSQNKEELLNKIPERCSKCHSRWWKIWEKDRVQCQFCFYIIDQSKYTGKLPKHCPNCKKAKYTKKHFSKMLNYSKEIREKFISEYREFMSKQKIKVQKFTPKDVKVTKFEKHIQDKKEEDVEERLK